jgi:hypothetical protein
MAIEPPTEVGVVAEPPIGWGNVGRKASLDRLDDAARAANYHFLLARAYPFLGDRERTILVRRRGQRARSIGRMRRMLG